MFICWQTIETWCILSNKIKNKAKNKNTKKKSTNQNDNIYMFLVSIFKVK